MLYTVILTKDVPSVKNSILATLNHCTLTNDSPLGILSAQPMKIHGASTTARWQMKNLLEAMLITLKHL